MREKFCCGLDIGSHAMKAAVIRLPKNKEPELAAFTHLRTHGLHEGDVCDFEELSECVHGILQETAKQAGVKIKELQLGLGANWVEAKISKALIPLLDRSGKVVTKEDLAKVNRQAQLLGVKVEEEILHDLPQIYQVDDVGAVLNPLGLHGRKLGVRTLLILAGVNRTKNIVRAVHHAGFEAARMHFTSLVSSKLIFSPQEKMNGCALTDIGARTTGILVFKQGILQAFHKIPLGGDDVTQAIASGLNLPFDLAEEIKRSYAVALSADRHQQEEILVKRENSYIPIKRVVIYKAMENILSEMVREMKTGLQNSGFYDQIPAGMMLIGGGGLLAGLIERIEQELIPQCPVKLGKLNLLSGKMSGSAALFASAAALGCEGSPRKNIIPKDAPGILKRIAEKTRELYEDYF